MTNQRYAEFLAESNQIEGYWIPPEDYLAQMDATLDHLRYMDEEVQLIINSIEALDLVKHFVAANKAPTVERVKQIHAVLMKNLLQKKYTGEYRPDYLDVMIGGRVTPKGDEFNYLEEQLFDFLNNSKDNQPMDILYRHFLFEYWHPFVDGNGRTGRYLWLWDRLRHNHDPVRMLQHFGAETTSDAYWTRGSEDFVSAQHNYYRYLQTQSTQVKRDDMKAKIKNIILEKFSKK